MVPYIPCIYYIPYTYTYILWYLMVQYILYIIVYINIYNIYRTIYVIYRSTSTTIEYRQV